MNRVTIIGAGNMGGAIGYGLVKSKQYPAHAITIADKSEAILHAFKSQGFNVSNNNSEAISNADLIILAVKPYLVETVLSELKTIQSHQILLSVAAGVDSQDIIPHCNGAAVVLCMPNTGIALLESMTCIASSNATETTLDKLKAIFDLMGRCFIIEESQMGAATVIAGCGPAFALRFIKAVINGGIEIGFKPNQIKEMAAQITKAAVELALNSEEHPEALIEKITTPGGITITGLNEMERSGFSASIIQGMVEANNKLK